MAVLKCKMCGGTLDVAEGMTVCECEYCGTKQTVTTSKDENKQGLFNRANFLRMKSEFDKAEQLYEKLVQSDPNDAEAHWGLILCKFGIEYVEDPATFKRIPTCHRTSFDSIIADEDYKEALRCADTIQRGVYEAEAKEIDRLQKEILALSAKEEPYDVFICYKESDNGSRTPDSVIANDIYHQLTNEGLKVFYAAITLEDKLGSAYEPCIFAALNSAKVMLAIGTKPEYFTAVWVRNEWSRFLKMMKTDRSKLLIPCYKDMDAYELPEEFAHLQAQDMSKIGFINDIVRGIKKVIVKDEPKPVQTVVTQVSSGNANVDSLLKRVFIFIEDGDWQSADEYCEKVLDIDPKNAEAYLGKLMADMKMKKRESLKNCTQPFDGSSNYKKVMRYGDDVLKTELQNFTNYIKDRNHKAYLESVYQEATEKMKSTKTVQEYEEVKQLLITIRAYKDAEVLIAKCDEAISAIKAKKEEIYRKAYAMAASGDYYHAVLTYCSIPKYKDSFEQIKKCAESSRMQSEQQKERINSLKKQQENIQAELTDLKNKIATLKKQQQQMVSCRDSLRKSKEDHHTLTQQRETFAAELSGLGVFAFSRKKQLQASINDCDAQLAVLSKNISALENGTDYDAVIQQIQTEIEEMKKSCSDLKQKIENMQKNIDAAQDLAENTTGDFEILEFGVRINSVSALTIVTFTTDLKKVKGYIKSNKISELIISDSVTSIGEWAFQDCTSLTSLTIPDSVTSIGVAAFKGCIGLADDKGFVIIRNVLYSYRGNDGAVTIPDSVTSIGDEAFCDCDSLTSVTIPDSVTSIEEKAFAGCWSLTSVTIPESVTSIGESAFHGCSSLTSVTIPDSVTSIGDYAFYGCEGLSDVKGFVIIRNVLYSYYGNDSVVTIPDSVTSIGDEAFCDCDSLTSVTIPDSVTSIGDYAFCNCDSLTSVTIPDSVTSIGWSAFSGCKKLTIKFKKGSYAESYAKRNNIPFREI